MDDKIPVFKKWSHWYWFLILFLGVQILFFYLFTRIFD